MRIVLADDAALLREGLAGLLAQAGHEVVAQVADADALREEVAALAAAGALPDVVVTDVRMPPTGTDDGLRAAVDLRRDHPGLPVIVLSAYVAGPYLRDLLQGTDGAVGYLLKERVGRVADFLHSLDVVTSGGVVVDPEVLAHVMGTRAAGGQDGAASHREEHHEDGGAHARGPGHGLADRDAAGRRRAGPGRPDGDGRQRPDGDGRGAGIGLNRLTPRETEVLALMAEGLSNTQIAQRLVLSDGAVAKHVASIFRGLDLPPSEDNRRVRAVLTWLRATA